MKSELNNELRDPEGKQSNTKKETIQKYVR